MPASPPVLVVVDPQRDFFRGGELAVPGADRIIEPINELMDMFASVVITQDWHPPGHVSFAASHPGCQIGDHLTLPHGEQQLWPVHCVADTAGAEIDPRIAVPPQARIIRKGTRTSIDSYSGFFENDGVTPVGLHDLLVDLSATSIVVAGLATDVCVLATVLDACRLGYDVTVVEEASAAIDCDGSLSRAWAQMNAAAARRAATVTEAASLRRRV